VQEGNGCRLCPVVRGKNSEKTAWMEGDRSSKRALFLSIQRFQLTWTAKHRGEERSVCHALKQSETVSPLQEEGSLSWDCNRFHTSAEKSQWISKWWISSWACLQSGQTPGPSHPLRRSESQVRTLFEKY
jgi:hypothetical protein